MNRYALILLSALIAAQSAWAQIPQKHHYKKELYIPLVEPKLNEPMTPKRSVKGDAPKPKSEAKPVENHFDYKLSRKSHIEGIAYYEKEDWLNAFKCFKIALENRPGDWNSKYALDKSIKKLVASGGAYIPKLQDEIKIAKTIRQEYSCPEYLRYCSMHVANNKFFYSLGNRFVSALSMYDIDEDKFVTLQYDINDNQSKDTVVVCESSGDEIQDAKVLEAFKLAMPFLRTFWLDVQSMQISNSKGSVFNPPLRTPEIIELEKCEESCLMLYKRGKKAYEQGKYPQAIVDSEAAANCALPAFKYLVEQQLADSYFYYAIRIEKTNPKLAKEYLMRVKKLQPERITPY